MLCDTAFSSVSELSHIGNKLTVFQNATGLVSSHTHQIQLHELDCVGKCCQHLCGDLESIYKKSSKNARVQGFETRVYYIIN